MHPSAEKFRRRARERYDVDVEIHEFPEGTKTAADAAAAVGCDVAQIASSIVLRAGDVPVVAVTSGANRVSEEKLAEEAGVDPAAVEMADAESIKGTLGWSIGGVPPFCHETAVPVFFDETLAEFETVWAAAGTPSAVFPISPDELREHADATTVDLAE